MKYLSMLLLLCMFTYSNFKVLATPAKGEDGVVWDPYTRAMFLALSLMSSLAFSYELRLILKRVAE